MAAYRGFEQEGLSNFYKYGSHSDDVEFSDARMDINKCHRLENLPQGSWLAAFVLTQIKANKAGNLPSGDEHLVGFLVYKEPQTETEGPCSGTPLMFIQVYDMQDPPFGELQYAYFDKYDWDPLGLGFRPAYFKPVFALSNEDEGWNALEKRVFQKVSGGPDGAGPELDYIEIRVPGFDELQVTRYAVLNQKTTWHAFKKSSEKWTEQQAQASCFLQQQQQHKEVENLSLYQFAQNTDQTQNIPQNKPADPMIEEDFIKDGQSERDPLDVFFDYENYAGLLNTAPTQKSFQTFEQVLQSPHMRDNIAPGEIPVFDDSKFKVDEFKYKNSMQDFRQISGNNLMSMSLIKSNLDDPKQPVWLKVNNSGAMRLFFIPSSQLQNPDQH